MASTRWTTLRLGFWMLYPLSHARSSQDCNSRISRLISCDSQLSVRSRGMLLALTGGILARYARQSINIIVSLFPGRTAKKRVESIIDFTTDFKSIVKSRHDFTVKSSALDLRLILLSNQLRINNSFDAFFHCDDVGL